MSISVMNQMALGNYLHAAKINYRRHLQLRVWVPSLQNRVTNPYSIKLFTWKVLMKMQQ